MRSSRVVKYARLQRPALSFRRLTTTRDPDRLSENYSGRLSMLYLARFNGRKMQKRDERDGVCVLAVWEGLDDESHLLIPVVISDLH